MKAVGIIVEYNPFHNGHAYHLMKSKEKSQADCTIAVMSGNFLQRGEPALVSKWSRTKMALANGVDLVIELPFAYATQNAETFALGGVGILHQMNCSSISFGSEIGEVEPFLEALSFIEKNKQQYDKELKLELSKGLSFPKASTEALKKLKQTSVNRLDLSLPNNILGFHYVKAIKYLNASIIPITIARHLAQYHDTRFTSEKVASATSIRKSLLETNRLEDVGSYIPDETKKLLHEYQQQYGLFHTWENYFPFLQYKLLTETPNELFEIFDMEEGLEYRLKEKIRHASSFYEFMQQIKTKRYTWTRLQRICVHLLTNTRKEQMSKGAETSIPPYLRLLGMNKRGQQYLKQIKKQVEVPIISKLSALEHPLLQLDIRAAQTYALAFPPSLRKKAISDEFSTPPLRHLV